MKGDLLLPGVPADGWGTALPQYIFPGLRNCPAAAGPAVDADVMHKPQTLVIIFIF